MSWADVKAIHGTDRVLLGPSASYQWTHDPKHLLFVLARYKHAARLIGDADDVLEVGCGEGIGARLLMAGRSMYVGMDTDSAALAVADEMHGSLHLNFQCDDICEDAESGDWEAVVALDVLEHIEPAQADAFLRNIANKLADFGACVIGTPNATAAAYQSDASRAGHVNLYEADRLEALMRRHFWTVTMFGMNDEVLHTGFLPMCHYLMAVGVGRR